MKVIQMINITLTINCLEKFFFSVKKSSVAANIFKSPLSVIFFQYCKVFNKCVNFV